MSAPSGQPPPTLWHVCDAWLHRATEIIAGSADALDAMNVFPVSDADTGSNLRLTLAGIVAAVPTVGVAAVGVSAVGVSTVDPEQPPRLDGLVQAAILSAHGNSGAILAEMFTSVCRSLEHDHRSLRATPPGTLLARLLRTVATAARRAVARPLAGTILTVADDTATAAEQAAAHHPEDVLAVALAARSGARDALARTPDQLQVLAEAGVVDAGGQAYSLLVDALVEVLGGPVAVALTGGPGVPPRIRAPRAAAPGDYEVMYALQGAPPEALDRLRERLGQVGHSVVVVGDEAMAQVHVHLAEAGAAVEAGLGSGRLSGIRITALPSDVAPVERTVVSVVAGSGLAQAVRGLGGVPVVSAGATSAAAELSALVRQSCGDVVILPNDPDTLQATGPVVTELRGSGRRVAVIPTVAQVQGLAALAVHEPAAEFEAAVVAMSSAAGHARHGAVTVAESSAMTMAGRCDPGDVLGAVGGDFVEVGSSVVEVSWRVVQRLLAAGGDLLTLVTGAQADERLVVELADRVRRSAAGVDVEVVAGGQPRYLLLIGLE